MVAIVKVKALALENICSHAVLKGVNLEIQDWISKHTWAFETADSALRTILECHNCIDIGFEWF